MNLKQEAEFFHYIAPKVRELVLNYDGHAPVAAYKARPGDYATEIDVAAENLIVSEIQKRFPTDTILAEEGHTGTVISDSRIWIIDPICGTANLGRGMKNFCSNIALADKGELIAACVVDHSQEDYLWSVGNNRAYINDKVIENVSRDESFGLVIDVDLGAVSDIPKSERKKCTDVILQLVLQPEVMLQSLNSSLSFAYVASGKVDGFINVANHPWDICAGSFLIQQSGGIITDLVGKPWQLNSVGAIGAVNKAVHKKLLHAYSEA